MDRKETVKPEPTYETIPNEFWPKCDWCGDELGDGSIEIIQWEGHYRICLKCQAIFSAMSRNFTPIILGEFLAQYGNDEQINSEEIHDIGLDELEEIAIQNMRESQ